LFHQGIPIQTDKKGSIATNPIINMANSLNSNNQQPDFKTLSSTVYQRLRDEILDGELKPGERLVRRTLAKQMGVSPIPVTEALWRLEQDGLVESVPMYGSRVKALSIEGIENENVLRMAIECQAARLCARNASDRDLETLMEKAISVDKMMTTSIQTKEGKREHLEFHLTVADLSAYPILRRELERAGFLELMQVNWINATLMEPVPPDHHQKLVKALLTRDSDKAEKQMRNHVAFGRNNLRKALEQREKSKG